MLRLSYIVVVSLISISAFGQIRFLQLELVDKNIGTPNEIENEPTNTSNDDVLNQIFLTHNISYYYQLSTRFPLSLDGSADGNFNELICEGCNTENLLNDLNAHTEVVKYASIGSARDGYFNNALRVELTDGNIGIPIGVVNGLVMTNDDQLNQIFSDYNVRRYDIIESSTTYSSYNALICSCDAAELKFELDNYPSVVKAAYRIRSGVRLSIEEVALSETKITPNPFKYKISIETEATLAELTLFDILGKKVYNSKDPNAFEDFSATLKSGVYLLKLISESGFVTTKKIIKS